MKAEGVAILIILIFAIGIIGIFSMSMFDKIPVPENNESASLVKNVSVPMVDLYGRGLTAFEIGLGILAVIAGLIVVYKVVYK